MIVTNKGMILEKLGEWANEKVDEGYRIFEAILACPWCMPSLHSFVGYTFYFIFFGVQWELLFAYPIIAFGSSFCSGFTWTIYKFIVKLDEYYSHKEQLACIELEEKCKSLMQDKYDED